jgi:hypothetical protein
MINGFFTVWVRSAFANSVKQAILLVLNMVSLSAIAWTCACTILPSTTNHGIGCRQVYESEKKRAVNG